MDVTTAKYLIFTGNFFTYGFVINMVNITLYGKHEKDINLKDILSQCPEDYKKIFEEKMNNYALIREIEGDEPYIVTVNTKTNNPKIYNLVLSVTGPNPTKVKKISDVLHERIGFETAKRDELKEKLDIVEDAMETTHQLFYAFYKATHPS